MNDASDGWDRWRSGPSLKHLGRTRAKPRRCPTRPDGFPERLVWVISNSFTPSFGVPVSVLSCDIENMYYIIYIYIYTCIYKSCNVGKFSILIQYWWSFNARSWQMVRLLISPGPDGVLEAREGHFASRKRKFEPLGCSLKHLQKTQKEHLQNISGFFRFRNSSFSAAKLRCYRFSAQGLVLPNRPQGKQWLLQRQVEKTRFYSGGSSPVGKDASL